MKPVWIALVALALVSTTSLAEQARGLFDVDRDYVFALATANQFLSAWRARDSEAGLRLASPSLKARFSEGELALRISGLSNPHNEAFEIWSGKRLPDGRLAFHVRLYTYYTGEKWADRSILLRIVLVKTGPETWLVDELPAPVK